MVFALLSTWNPVFDIPTSIIRAFYLIEMFTVVQTVVQIIDLMSLISMIFIYLDLDNIREI